ncbi:MAG: PAC2 family protein [Acidimicrobiales bacterium]|nr:PAC2 family protein [Acidimicrobiales bacterium]
MSDPSPLLEILERPDLDSPVLLMAMQGWVDAGAAAMACREALLSGGGNSLIARLDTDRLLDHRARRPTVDLVDGVSRSIKWPLIQVHLLERRGGSDLLLLDGPEPDHEWREFSAAVVELCRTLDVRMVIGLGAYPAAVPHTRPTRLACTAGSEGLTRKLDFVASTLSVPAGIQAVIEVEAAAAGIQAVGVWAQVPHYLAAASYPPASLALLEALVSLSGAILDTGSLPERTLATRSRLDELVARNPEHVTMLEQLEAAYDDLHDPAGRLPTGEDLAAELERFLRARED